MKSEEYCSYDALGLSELVIKGEVKEEEVFKLAADLVKKVNGDLNAVSEFYEYETASSVMSEKGVFEGVPFPIKDITVGIKGFREDNGSRLAEGHIVPETSYFMEKILGSGLMPLCRTTCPEFGLTMSTESILTGATRNPWNTNRIAGGSSGGSGALVAAGAVPIAHANDGGGSIRVPAAINGNVGLKHSRGRVSHAPDFSDLTMPMVTQGANARSVRDVAALLDVVSGHAPGEATIPPPDTTRYLDEVKKKPKDLKIALCLAQWSKNPVNDAIQEKTREIGKQCEDLGHHVEEAAPDIDGELYINTMKGLWSILAASVIMNSSMIMGRSASLDYIEPMSLRLCENGLSKSALDYIVFMQQAHHITRVLGRFFESYDLILTPTLAQPTPEIGSRVRLEVDEELDPWFDYLGNIMPYTPIANVTGVPAITLPLCEGPGGLPLGMQFIAAIGREDLLFRISGQLEEALPWKNRKPAIWAAS